MARWLDALRWSPPALHLQAALARRQRRRLPHDDRTGTCPVCGTTAGFVAPGPNHREAPMCRGCGSVPRQRALHQVVAGLHADLGRLAVHEASPSLGSWCAWRRHCRSFIASLWLPGRRPGARVGAFRHVDLQQQPFADGSFDLVVTQDVLEHVPDPCRALGEIHRTLRPGGHHVFTVPRRSDQPTTARVVFRDGVPQHLLPAEYHRDPSTRAGSLVVTDWGMDLEAVVADRTGIRVTARRVTAAAAGVFAAVEVFVAPRNP